MQALDTVNQNYTINTQTEQKTRDFYQLL